MKRKNSNKNRIFLSVTALLLILLVGVGFTYSWIEGGTTYSIFTEDSNDVKTGATPSKNGYTDLEINPEGTDTINLGQFDKTTNNSQSLTFSEVSSADGENFYFPTAFEGGVPTAYRKSNTNDIGTKFINFNFDADVSQKCYLAFNGAPTFTLTKNGQTIADTSAFRIMIKSGEERKILTTAAETQTSTVVTDVNGTTATLTAEPVNNYTYNLNHSKKLFEYEDGDTPNIEVSVWLDGETANSELLRGSDVTVDMKLIAVQEKYSITFDAVTYDNSGSVVSDGNSFTGGKIKVGTTEHSKLFVESYFSGESFTAKATANTNYEFIGWYSDKNCSVEVTSSDSLTSTVSGPITYYAKFVEKPKYTVSAEVKTVPEDHVGGTVKVNNSGTSVTDYKDATVTLTATANNSYRFDGWYTDEECNTPLGNSNTSLTQTVTVGSSDATYYAKFVKQNEITFIAKTNGEEGNRGGNVKINNGTAAASVTTKVDEGSSVTLEAVKANDKSKLLGIYDSTGKLLTALKTYTFNASGDATYYADFELTSTTTTIYFKTRSGFSKYNAYVYNKADESIKYPTGASWPGTETKLDPDTGYYKFSFDTSDTGSFRVIVNDGSNQYPGQNQAGLEGEIGGTYLFGDSTLDPFDPDDIVKETTTTIYFEPRVGFSKYNVWAYTTYDNFSGGTWPGNAATYDSSSGFYKYSFKTTVTGKFNIILSNNGDNKYPPDGGITLSADIGGTYFFAAGSPTSLPAYTPDSKVSITLTDGTSNSWIHDSNAVIYLRDTTANKNYTMTKFNDTTWKVTVPATVKNIEFSRRDPNNTNTVWGKVWSTGSRGTKITYKATGDNAGSWQ